MTAEPVRIISRYWSIVILVLKSLRLSRNKAFIYIATRVIFYVTRDATIAKFSKSRTNIELEVLYELFSFRRKKKLDRKYVRTYSDTKILLAERRP